MVENRKSAFFPHLHLLGKTLVFLRLGVLENVLPKFCITLVGNDLVKGKTPIGCYRETRLEVSISLTVSKKRFLRTGVEQS